jgi:hypothetical protein
VTSRAISRARDFAFQQAQFSRFQPDSGGQNMDHNIVISISCPGCASFGNGSGNILALELMRFVHDIDTETFADVPEIHELLSIEKRGKTYQAI